MRILRSWPASIPPGRAYVVDQLERLVMDDYDYRLLSDVGDDVLLVEWDLAVSIEDLTEMVARCRRDPERPRVAPYRLYVSPSGRPLDPPRWAHRRIEGDRSRHVTPDDATCHLFGLGLTYVPRWVIDGICSSWAGTVNDTSLSGWHHVNAEQPDVPIDWDIRPVHLHYDPPQE
jgi:hypothetical protein